VRRVVLTLFALTAAGLVLTACGERPSPGPWADIPIPQKVEGSHTVTRYWPLTGLKLRSNKTAKLRHRVLVAKMDNTVSSRPQVGLRKADMVVEELVEGGLTRLAVFYYSHLPGIVGPIRSMRASDIDVVSPEVRTGTPGNARPNSSAVRRAPVTEARSRRAPQAGQA